MDTDTSPAALELLRDMARLKHEEPWPEPVDFLADHDAINAPELKPEHLPDGISRFVFDTAERLGVDPAAVALGSLVSLASVATDDWSIQPKQHDTSWREQPRIWGAIIADPSAKKSPILNAVKKPIDRLDAEARERHKEEMRAYRIAHKKWKDTNGEPEAEPWKPRLGRHIVEATTIEALQEVLRDDDAATMHAPAKKVLAYQDELTEWICNMDRYRASGGGGDRGAWLRAYNGGRHSIDRIGRGNFAVANWSACVLGGIQPEPIRSIAGKTDDDGLLQRFMFCVPAYQGPDIDRAEDYAAVSRYEAIFPALAALKPPRDAYGAPQVVKMTAGAQDVRKAFEALVDGMKAMPDTPMRLRTALAKMMGLWGRLVLLFHLIEHADARAQQADQRDHLMVVPLATVERATAYLRNIILPHRLRAEAVMFDSAQLGTSRAVADWLIAQRTPMTEVRIRDVQRYHKRLAGPEKRAELLTIMQSLVDMDWLQPLGDPLRPVAWEVNPRIYSSFQQRAEAERARRQAEREKIRVAAEFRRQLKASQ